MRPAVWSPHFRPRTRPVTLFVIHSTRSGAIHEDEIERYWFSGASGLSAHFVGDASGGLTEVVPLQYAAAHAGEHNPYSVGIELTQTKRDVPYQEGHYVAAALAFSLTNKYLGERIIPKRRVMSASVSGIIGHEDTEQGKSDPGPLWDWEYFLSLL